MAFASDKTRQGAAGQGAAGYSIDNSLRFNDDDSAYLSRSFVTPTNTDIFTVSCWVKRGNSGLSTSIFTQKNAPNVGDWSSMAFVSDKLHWRDKPSGTITVELKTSRLFRDSSAWYHLVFIYNSSDGTSGDRAQIWVNGVRETEFDTETYPTQHLDSGWNTTGVRAIGTYNTAAPEQSYDGHIAEVHFIDGTALTPSSFGEEDTDYKHWKPKEVTGLTYGNNGFYLDFKLSAATSSGLGNDANGSNNWTPNNLASTDQMIDTPTNNFCTWNPLDKPAVTLSEGNLKLTDTGIGGVVRGSIANSSGKFYWEAVNLGDSGGGGYPRFGITTPESLAADYARVAVTTVAISGTVSGISLNGSPSITQYVTNDIIQIALDLDNGKCWVGINNTWMNSGNPTTGANPIFNITSGTSVTPANATYNGEGASPLPINFGQDSSFAGNKTAQGNQDSNSVGDFYYTPPSGYLALCTSNLTAPAVKPQENFNTVLYTGNSTDSRSIAVGFQPDMTWIKIRNAAGYHYLVDSVRGLGTGDSMRVLGPNDSEVEYTTENDQLRSFDSDGFTLDSNTPDGTFYINRTSDTYVAWNWKAGNATLGTGDFTQGSIASTCSRNVDAGFSIVSYTGNGVVDATVGHGLSKAPEIVIYKRRNIAGDWYVYDEDIGLGYKLKLNDTGAKSASSNEWTSAPSTTLLTHGSSGGTNGSTQTFIAYCFHSVDGYSKVGSYTGNGLADGTFVYTGFRPAYVMIKNTASTGTHWIIWDKNRNGYNDDNTPLYANLNGGEGTSGSVDLTSNGFKLRTTSSIRNESGSKFIYLAFAEYPFKYTTAR